MAGKKKRNKIECVDSIEEIVAKDEDNSVANKQRKFFESRKSWPNACIECRGEGASISEEECDDGGIIVDGLTCPKCLKVGKCPRCTRKFPKGWKTKLESYTEGSENPLKCPSCKWTDGDPPVLEEKPFKPGS